VGYTVAGRCTTSSIPAKHACTAYGYHEMPSCELAAYRATCMSSIRIMHRASMPLGAPKAAKPFQNAMMTLMLTKSEQCTPDHTHLARTTPVRVVVDQHKVVGGNEALI
jgi:hypothetical protein